MRTHHRVLGLVLICAMLGASLSSALASKGKAPAEGEGLITSRYVGKKGLPALPDGPLVTLGASWNLKQHVSKAQYTDLRNAVIQILTRYNPNKHFFIGTGRDPAPLTAMLELLGGRQVAMNFPASNIVTNSNITPELMGTYFKRLVPNEAMRAEILSGKRAIVLFDQTSSGKTPATFAPYMQAYLDSIGSPAKIKKLAVGQRTYEGVAVISTKKFPDVDNYAWGNYEGVVSEYPRHSLGSNAIGELKRRPAYGKFKNAVLERMKRDLVLHRFLVSELGVSAK